MDPLVMGCALEMVENNGDAAKVWRERPPSVPFKEAQRIHFDACRIWASAKALTEAALIRARVRVESDRRRRGTGVAT